MKDGGTEGKCREVGEGGVLQQEKGEVWLVSRRNRVGFWGYLQKEKVKVVVIAKR